MRIQNIRRTQHYTIGSLVFVLNDLISESKNYNVNVGTLTSR